MKKKLTVEEEDARYERMARNRRYAGFKRSLVTLIRKHGLRGMELKREFMIANPGTPLTDELEWSRQERINAMEYAIGEWRDELLDAKRLRRQQSQ